MWFQSALAPKDERYQASKTMGPIFCHVSIRSRPEGREIPSLQDYGANILPCFNPLSPRRTRDTEPAWPYRRGTRVSIRSRPEGREIHEHQGHGYLIDLFQSALAPKDERYPGRDSVSRRVLFRFQSALAPKDERYLLHQVLEPSHPGFNPLSPRRTRDTITYNRRSAVSNQFQSALAPKDERYGLPSLAGAR